MPHAPTILYAVDNADKDYVVFHKVTLTHNVNKDTWRERVERAVAKYLNDNQTAGDSMLWFDVPRFMSESQYLINEGVEDVEVYHSARRDYGNQAYGNAVIVFTGEDYIHKHE